MLTRFSLAVLLCLSGSAFAQSLGSPTVAFGVRSFGGDEGLAHFNLAVGESLCQSFKVQFLGDFSRWATFNRGSFGIRHGGTDAELLASYSPDKTGLDLSVGVDDARTPERSEGNVTYRASYALFDCPYGRLGVESYGIAMPDPILMVGSFYHYRLGSMGLFASAAGPTSGKNMVSTNSGNRIRGGVFEVGADFKVWNRPDSSVRLALTNQVGWTTGTMTTPALGNTAGVEASVTVRF